MTTLNELISQLQQIVADDPKRGDYRVLIQKTLPNHRGDAPYIVDEDYEDAEANEKDKTLIIWGA